MQCSSIWLRKNPGRRKKVILLPWQKILKGIHFFLNLIFTLFFVCIHEYLRLETLSETGNAEDLSIYDILIAVV
jgi:hypothetical protein